MYPELMTLSYGEQEWTVMSYSFFYFCAIIFTVIGTFFSIYCWKNFSAQKAGFLLCMITMGGFVGARLWHVVTNWSLYVANDAQIFAIDMENFAIVGGLLGAVIIGILMSRIFRFDMWKIADRAVIFLGGGIALARIGCFLNGCCFGKITQMPWGVKFPVMSNAHVYQIIHGEGSLLYVRSVHPTQLYEFIAALIGSVIAWYCLKRDYHSGVAAAAFGLWYAFFRLINMHFRIFPDSLQISQTAYSLIYICIMIMCCAVIFIRTRDHVH